MDIAFTELPRLP